jgi:HEPN domain-containing protein
MKNNADLAQKWLKMADAEFAAAEALMEAGVALAGVCFHCQQAAEKSIKAWLMTHNVEAPKTHKLKQLVELSIQAEPRFSEFLAEAEALTPYAVERRYDADFWPSIDEARAALEQARRIYDFVKGHWT